jgi:hypothetical protein
MYNPYLINWKLRFYSYLRGLGEAKSFTKSLRDYHNYPHKNSSTTKQGLTKVQCSTIVYQTPRIL